MIDFTEDELFEFKRLATKVRTAEVDIGKLPQSYYALANFRELIQNSYEEITALAQKHPEFQRDFKDIPADIAHKNPVTFQSALKILRIFLDGIENYVVKNQIDTPPDQFIILPGQAFTASKIIRSILEQSKKEVKIIDNYMSEDSVSVLETANRERDILILTKNINKSFVDAIEIAKKGWGGKIEVKESPSFHDRYLIIDNKDVWMCGPSIDYLGVKKPGVIVKIDEPVVTNTIINIFDEEWKKY